MLLLSEYLGTLKDIALKKRQSFAYSTIVDWLVQGYFTVIVLVTIVYCALLTTCIFQTYEDIKYAMAYMDENLKENVTFPSYVKNCDIFTNSKDAAHTIWENLDIYIISHMFGWAFFQFAARNLVLSFIISLGFEFVEYSLEHQLPMLSECWWDKYILDYLFANAVGIFAAHFCMKTFGVEQFEWQDLWNQKQRTPFFNMIVFINVVVWAFIYLISTVFIFYLEVTFSIPYDHPIVITRTVVVASLGVPTARQLYDVINGNSYPKVEMCCQFYIVFAEAIIISKFNYKLVSQAPPNDVIYSWLVLSITFAVYCMHVYRTSISKQKHS